MTDLTVNVTAIIENDNIPSLIIVDATNIKNNKFKVYASEPWTINWTVYGKRQSIKVEVNKLYMELKSSGPYQWLE